MFREHGAELNEEKVMSIVSKQEGKFTIELESAITNTTRLVNFYVVDTAKGLGVIENTGSRYKYQLVVAAEKIRSYPLIINECNVKADEFSFELPDYKNLLSKFKE